MAHKYFESSSKNRTPEIKEWTREFIVIDIHSFDDMVQFKRYCNAEIHRHTNTFRHTKPMNVTCMTFNLMKREFVVSNWGWTKAFMIRSLSLSLSCVCVRANSNQVSWEKLWHCFWQTSIYLWIIWFDFFSSHFIPLLNTCVRPCVSCLISHLNRPTFRLYCCWFDFDSILYLSKNSQTREIRRHSHS